MLKYFKYAVVIFVLSTAACAANMKIENEKLSVEFDSRGNLTSLKNKATGEDYAGGQGLWRIIYQDGDSLEEALDSEKVSAQVEKTSDSQITLKYGGTFPVKVSCFLTNEEVRFKATVENSSKNFILREFQFPMIKNAAVPNSAQCVNSGGGGTLIPNFRKYVSGAETGYKARDDISLERYSQYPISRTMNMYAIQNPKGALYMAGLSDDCQLTLHYARYRREASALKYLDLGFVKYPFIKSGETFSTGEFSATPILGDWRKAARLYAGALKNRFENPQTPQFVSNMNGWQRVIMRHQYGKILHPYGDLADKIGRAGLECGIDTVLLFGWWKEGMDAGYPSYSPEDSQGGDAELRRQIQKIHSEGGKVVLYFNGQLIDISSPFFKSGVGRRICVKNSDMSAHLERYPFGGDGTGLRVLGHKTFTTACHATKEWEDVLKGYVDRALFLGVDGVFFDQMGNGGRVCWDASHNHKVPCTDAMKYKAKMLEKIRAYIKAKNPNVAFGTEYVGDATTPHVDFVHSCGHADYYATAANTPADSKPVMRYVPLFKYAFPKTRMSDRTIRDDSDIPRRVNRCLMWGLTSDIEIYRCRGFIDDAPNYKAYLKKADALREKYRALILNGIYRDCDLAEVSDKSVEYTTFENDTQIAVLLTDSRRDNPAKFRVRVRGGRFAGAESIGGADVVGGGDDAECAVVKLGAKNSLALLVFSKPAGRVFYPVAHGFFSRKILPALTVNIIMF